MIVEKQELMFVVQAKNWFGVTDFFNSLTMFNSIRSESCICQMNKK